LASATAVSVLAAALLRRLDAALPAPPLEVDGVADWAAQQGTAAAAMALLRLGGMGLACYAATVSGIAFLGALTRSVRLLRLADRASAGLLPRLAAGALTVGVASSSFAAATAGALPTPTPSFVSTVAAAPATGGGVTMHLDLTDDAAPIGPTTTSARPTRAEPNGPTAAPTGLGAATAPAAATGAEPSASRSRTGPDAAVTMRLEVGSESDAGAASVTAPPVEVSAEPAVATGSVAAAVTEPMPTMRLEPSADDANPIGGTPASVDGAGGHEAIPEAEAPVDDAGPVMHLETAPAGPEPVPAAGGVDASAGLAASPQQDDRSAATTGDTWTVRPGDHLWAIAEAVVGPTADGPVDEAAVARYWESLVELNRSRLADPGNADLLFAGQVMLLPPWPDAA
jgi:hypothetical protein